MVKTACLISLAAGLALLCSCGKSSPERPAKSAPPPGASLPTARVEVVTKSGVEMVYLPGAEFTMGTSQGNADEGPPHKIKLTSFMMDKYPVTHEMFTKVQLPNPSHWQDNPNKPVERVRWRDAKQYLQRAVDARRFETVL